MDLNKATELFMARFAGNRLAIEWYTNDGKKPFAPYCHNEFNRKAGCVKGKGVFQPCKNCEVPAFSGWTPETVQNHIFGRKIDKNTQKIKSHGVYLLMPDGTVNFAAVDFDDKHTFNDVRDFYFAAQSYGLNGSIARSTSKGWHIYYFFSEPVLAIKVRAVIFDIMSSFDWAVIPEVFPKQSRINDKDFGNLIKPPMIHPKMKEGRNCFVTLEDVPIGHDTVNGVNLEKQWDYLKNAPTISSYDIDDLIESNSIDTNIDSKSGRIFTFREDIPWTPPKSGDFIRVIQKCETIKRIVTSPLDDDIQHEHRFAMAIVAAQCKNGIEHLRSAFPAKQGDWEKGKEIDSSGALRGTPHLEHILEQVKKYNYRPYTCERFMEMGACKKKKCCLEKRLRMQKENGVYVPIHGEFLEPTPYRFAIDKVTGLSFEDLMSIARSTKGKEIDEVLTTFRENLPYISSLSDSNRLAITDAFNTHGKVKMSILKAAAREVIKKEQRSAEDQDVQFDNATYRLDREQCIMTKLVVQKEESKVIEFADFIPELKEIRILKDCEGNETVMYEGFFHTLNRKYKFSIPQETWQSRRMLPQVIGQLTRSRALLKEKHTEDFLIFVNRLGGYKERHILTSFGYFGENCETYYTPSVIIDKDGIRPNNKEQDMDLSMGKLSRFADLCMLGESEFKDTLSWFWKNVSTWLPANSTLPVMAFYFSIPVLGRFGKDTLEKPALWMQGSPSTGKTTLGRIMNCMFGDFYPIARKGAWTSTYNHICKDGSFMKDLPYLVDDFRKNIVPEKLPEQVINNYYDETGRGTLRRDGQFNEQRIIRGNLVSTGEEIPSDGGSLSRCIIVNFNLVKPNTPKLQDIEMKIKDYRGITPYFIHYLYQFSTSDFLAEISKWREFFDGNATGFCEARVIKNASLLALGASYFVQFMEHYGIVSEKEAELTMKSFTTAITEEIMNTSMETNKNQGAHQFINALQDLITMDAVKIDGYNHDRTLTKTKIGWVDTEGGLPIDGYVYINKRVALSEVMMFLKKSNSKLTHGERTIAQQLVSMNALYHEKNRSTVRKKVDGEMQRLWKFKKSVLGIPDQLRVVDADHDDQDYRAEDHPFN